MSREQALKEKVRGWLLAGDWTLNEGSSNDHAWMFHATFPGVPDLLIFVSKKQPDAMMLQFQFRQTDQQLNQWTRLDSSFRDQVRMELQFHLASTDLDFEIGEILESFSVTDTIYPEGQNRDSFWRRLRRVRNVMWSGAWIVLLAPQRAPLKEESAN